MRIISIPGVHGSIPTRQLVSRCPGPVSVGSPTKIKNVIKLAHNVAMTEGVPLRADHIRSALRANGYTIPTPGSKIDNSLYNY
jgi:hypothetical protein